MVFLKHLCFGFLLELEENTSLKKILVEAMCFLINKCFFAIGTMVFKQDIVIPMGVGPAPLWPAFFFILFEFK